MLWEDLGKAVGAFDEIVLEGAGQAAVHELIGIVNLCPEAEHFATGGSKRQWTILGRRLCLSIAAYVSLAIAMASPVNIFTGTPIDFLVKVDSSSV